MFRAPGEQKMLALVGLNPTNVDVARHKDWRFELNGHSTPKWSAKVQTRESYKHSTPPE
jgi:hypothetical protein